jgi:hypothetical protein
VLIAPDSSSLPPHSFLDEPRPRDVGVNYALIGLIAGLLVFTIIVGLGLVSGSVPLERAYALMALPPFCVMVWQSFGFVRETKNRDHGLIIGAAGWGCVVLALLIQHSALNSALAQGTPLSGVQTPFFATLLGFAATFLIALGAFLSFSYWRTLVSARNSL